MSAPGRQLLLPLDAGFWQQIRDGDSTARRMYERHYSSRRYRDGRRPRKFVGPGEYIALSTSDRHALLVWRRFRDASGQHGVNCAVFRNEAPELYQSSELILGAELIAWRRWPMARLYTYVNPRRVRRKRDPGRCFRRAGWRVCGETKSGLLILEKLKCDARSAVRQGCSQTEGEGR